MNAENHSPGLDLDRLRRLRPVRVDLEHLVDRLRAHLALNDGYVAFSGGKDSLVALHLALRADPAAPVVFFDSGFEFPETYRYLHDIQAHLSINLDVIPAQRSTLDLLRASGHWDHHAPTAAPIDIHATLITEPAAAAHARHGDGEIWGLRSAESRGRQVLHAAALRAETDHSCRGCCHSPHDRRRHHGGVVRRADGTVAYSPIWDWPTEQIWAHIAQHDLPINPVYAKLRALGAPEHFLRVSHMIDAQRLTEGRITWLRRGWPHLFDDLAALLPRLREFV